MVSNTDSYRIDNIRTDTQMSPSRTSLALARGMRTSAPLQQVHVFKASRICPISFSLNTITLLFKHQVAIPCLDFQPWSLGPRRIRLGIILVDSGYAMITRHHFLLSDILWSFLCRCQSISPPANLHTSGGSNVQREKAKRNATSRLLNLWQRLPRYVARSGKSIHVDYVRMHPLYMLTPCGFALHLWSKLIELSIINKLSLV